MHAPFCVFEGIDGVGKSSLIQCILQNLRLLLGEKPERILVLQEPSRLPSGQKIRKLLRSQAELKAEKWIELFVDDRKHNLRKNIRPNQKKGKWILQDRYFYSTAAYQGQDLDGRESLSPRGILEYHLEKKFPEPDFLFYLELDPQLAFERLESSRSQRESFEKKEYLERIAKNYEAILPKEAIRLDASLPLQTLCSRVLDSLKRKLESFG